MSFIRKSLFSLFLLYLIILPLIDHLNYKIYGKIGIDNIFFSFIFILCVAITAFSTSYRYRLRLFSLNPLFIGFIVLIVVAIFFPTISSYLLGQRPDPEQLTNGLRYVQMIGVLFVLNYLMKDWNCFEKIIKAYFCGALLAALFGLGQALNVELFWDITDRFYLIGQPFLSTYIDKVKMPSFWPQSGNAFGSFMTMSLLLSLGMKQVVSKGYLRLGIFYLVGLIISFSYTSIFACIIGSALFWLFDLFKRKSLRNKYKTYIKVAAFIVLIGIALVIISREKIAYRTTVYFTYSASNPLMISGLNTRYVGWEKDISVITSRDDLPFLIGGGYSDTGISDNNYIELFRAGGLISLIIYLTTLAFLLIITFQKTLSYENKCPQLSFIYRLIFIMFSAMAIMLLTGSYFAYLPTIMPLIILIVGSKNLTN